jgi:monofunctional biosynthetic peptidoglycan transglycosylase
MNSYKEIVLLDFRNQEEIPEWLIINDGVMGGMSTSDIAYNPEGYLVFTGNVSLQNNGGFASFRSQSKTFDLADYDGIKIRIRGDGKKYSLRLRTSSSFDGIAYAADFQSLKGDWQEIRIPFSDFTARFRGRIIMNAEALDQANIRQLGFLISDKQQGPFVMDIDWIKAYAD